MRTLERDMARELERFYRGVHPAGTFTPAVRDPDDGDMDASLDRDAERVGDR